jgi:8-hydroxy-5-deazaflavin:NADPH oxidoreductase
MMTRVGIIGADDRAVAIARILRGSGCTVSFSDLDDDRISQSAADLIGEGAYASTPYQQAATCDTLCLAVRWNALEAALAAIGSYKDGVVIDATRPPDLGTFSGAEILAHKLDNRHVVKAFVEPIEGRDAFIKIASDDPAARAVVGDLIANCGRSALDLGPLAKAREIERDVARQLQPQA